ncbi:hypothetical protein I3843_03G082100 [Carya illinoinensis]|nr:hypothetical protein I3843_03G082100 [Carya illinoinensis]
MKNFNKYKKGIINALLLLLVKLSFLNINAPCVFSVDYICACAMLYVKGTEFCSIYTHLLMILFSNIP